MTDIETALEQWREYDEAHEWMIMGPVVWAKDGVFDNLIIGEITEDHCIGWAHRELEKRGYCIWSQDRTAAGRDCEVEIYTVSDLSVVGDVENFGGLTLLGCFLDAIKATDPRERNAS